MNAIAFYWILLLRPLPIRNVWLSKRIWQLKRIVWGWIPNNCLIVCTRCINEDVRQLIVFKYIHDLNTTISMIIVSTFSIFTSTAIQNIYILYKTANSKAYYHLANAFSTIVTRWRKNAQTKICLVNKLMDDFVYTLDKCY